MHSFSHSLSVSTSLSFSPSHTCTHACTCFTLLHVLCWCVLGRWYIREGWLRTVPPKGKETKPKMFFLFSDILLLTKPCSSLHPTSSDKFECQRCYPLKECTVDKVFGHTKSQGGLISVSVCSVCRLRACQTKQFYSDPRIVDTTILLFTWQSQHSLSK